MKRFCRTLVQAIAASVLAAGTAAATAADVYPARPVKMIIPFAAGSRSDIVARIRADELRKVFMPKDVVERLNAEVNRVLQRPDIKAKLAELGGETPPGTPEEFAAFIRQQLESWRMKIQAAGLQPE